MEQNPARLAKTHWLDAACVGVSTQNAFWYRILFR